MLGGLGFLSHVFPVVRFAASLEWYETLQTVVLLPLALIVALQILALFWRPAELDAVNNARCAAWEKRGFHTRAEPLDGFSVYTTLMALFSAIFIFGTYVCAAEVWWPMAMIGFYGDQVALEYTVENLVSGRGNLIELEGFGLIISGIWHPPDVIWEGVAVGDTIRLHGTGNRWGVFYDEIELIKQQ